MPPSRYAGSVSRSGSHGNGLHLVGGANFLRPFLQRGRPVLAHCRPMRAMRYVCNRPKQTSTPGPARHTPPHSPRHTACRIDIPWVVRNSSIQSLDYRNGTSPLAPPTYIAGFSSYLDVQAGASPHWVHCVLLGSLLTTVAVQPGRCRRFIGTLLARIRFAPCTLRMGTRRRRSEKIEVSPLILRTRMRSCGKQFRNDLAEKIAMKVFRFSFF